MADDLYKIESSGLPDDTLVLGFRGSEGISRPYVFEIFLSIVSLDSAEFDLASGLEAKATLSMDRQDGTAPFRFNGIFSELSIIHEAAGRAIVRAVLVPKLWHLTQTLHSRIFTKESIPDIIKTTLADGGLLSDDYEITLTGQYDPEEHVCQYRESDFNFISRWMEREGIYYFFEQGDTGEKLIITDSKSTHKPLDADAITFRPRANYDGEQTIVGSACLDSFVCRQRTLPAEIKLRDYDYSKPDYNVSGVAPVSKTGLGEINSYGVRFFTADAGKRLAQTRAEDLLAREVVFTASGTAPYLRPGYLFTLQDHPRRTFDAKYLVTEVEHYSNQRAKTNESRALTGLDSDDGYRVNISAIPADTQFRAEVRAAWPRIYGTENGVVDGDADSPYAQIDDDGRYLVRFSFDESNLDDGKASTRVRMMQPHGGAVEGFHFPLRKGTEVMITFLGGDPDRPFIAGVVPNAVKPSVVGSRNHTQNIIRTGSKNQIVMEDEQGKEFIFMSSPNKATGMYMGNPTGPQSKVYTGESETFNNPDTASPGGGTSLTVSDLSLYQHTDGNYGLLVKGDSTTDIEGNEETFVKGNVSHGYHGSLKEQVLGATNEFYYATQTTNITGLHHVEVKGPRKDHVTDAVTENYDTLVTQTIGGGGLNQTIAGPRFSHWNGNAYLDGPLLSEEFPTIHQTASGSYTLTSPASTTFDSGGVTRTHLGTWTHDSAVTTWTTGVTDWTSPAVTVHCPAWTVDNGFWSSSGNTSTQHYYLTLAVAAVAIAIAPVNIQVAPAINITAQALVLQNQGFHLCTGGAEVKPKGFFAFV